MINIIGRATMTRHEIINIEKNYHRHTNFCVGGDNIYNLIFSI